MPRAARQSTAKSGKRVTIPLFSREGVGEISMNSVVAVNVNGLSMAFAAGAPVLADVSFEVREGEFF